MFARLNRPFPLWVTLWFLYVGGTFLLLFPALALSGSTSMGQWWSMYVFILLGALIIGRRIARFVRTRTRRTITEDENGYTLRVDWVGGRSRWLKTPTGN